MRNRYEFKIEEIHNVFIVSKTSDLQYTNIYSRKYDEDGNPTRLFVQTYNAEPEEIEGDKIKVICSRCEAWNVYDKSDYYDNEEFVIECEQCADDYEEIITEEDLVDIINSLMGEDFYDVSILINFIPIV